MAYFGLREMRKKLTGQVDKEWGHFSVLTFSLRSSNYKVQGQCPETILISNSVREGVWTCFIDWFRHVQKLKSKVMPLVRVTMTVVFALLACTSVLPAHAQEQEQDNFALPFEFEGDYGAPNGNALLLRFMPLWRSTVRENWSLVHLDLVTLADAPPLPGSPVNPEPVPGEQATGLSDWLHMTVYTPTSVGKITWGVGAVVGVPTATNDALGSGKWAAGPAARVTFQGEKWTIGAIAGQRWSFAGDSDRADVSSLLIRGVIRRNLGSGWYFVSAPIINANWNASSGNRWLVPVGGGFGKTFKLGETNWAASMQAYANAIKPAGAPDWSLRIAFVAPVPVQWLRR